MPKEIKRNRLIYLENISSELKNVINETKSKLTGSTEITSNFEEE